MGTRELTLDRLKELCRYDPETGEFFRIERAISGIDGRGYRRIFLDGAQYTQHRLALFYMNGCWPSGVVDHINGMKLDNRFSNLRDVAFAVNVQNRRGAQSNNLLGIAGVTKRGEKFEARIRVDGREIYLGLFATPEEAHSEFIKAKRKYHQGCTL